MILIMLIESDVKKRHVFKKKNFRIMDVEALFYDQGSTIRMDFSASYVNFGPLRVTKQEKITQQENAFYTWRCVSLLNFFSC